MQQTVQNFSVWFGNDDTFLPLDILYLQYLSAELYFTLNAEEIHFLLGYLGAVNNPPGQSLQIVLAIDEALSIR